ncbi:MAG: two-component system LytT family response regulator [Crocinitomicaceae bacterium]|jgi:two-component system LytT family response regulator
MIKAILIDDLQQARTTLKKDLEAYAKDLEVIGEADGVVSGAKMLKSLTPDIVFLDIQMQDGSGFDLLDILPSIDFKIIFITASDVHAIKAFRYAAIDYLVKPVDPDDLKNALQRFRENHLNENEKYKLLSDSLKNHTRPNERLALHAQDKINIVNIADIIRCESHVNYTTFYFMDGSRIVVTRTLKDFDDLLSDQGFYRVHQSHLVNMKFIREFVKGDGGYLLMIDGTEVPVSVRRRPAVLKMIEAL